MPPLKIGAQAKPAQIHNRRQRGDSQRQPQPSRNGQRLDRFKTADQSCDQNIENGTKTQAFSIM